MATPRERIGMAVYRSAIHKAIVESNDAFRSEIQSGSIRQDTDVSRELGMERQAVARKRRKDAVLDPEKFDAERQETYDEMEGRVKDAYMTSYNQYIKAGFTEEQSKSKGMHIARETRNALESAIESEFGDDSRAIAAAKQINQHAATRTGISW